MSGPRRAHELICKIGADTKTDLAFALEQFARDIMRGEITEGCSGSPSVGTIYSYSHNPDQTHAKYFEELNAYLEGERVATSSKVQPES